MFTSCRSQPARLSDKHGILRTLRHFRYTTPPIGLFRRKPLPYLVIASLDRKAKGLLQQSASACGMQAPSSQVATAKNRDLTRKQRSADWTGPSPIAKFLRCLRLLDLDLLEDWPGISEDTFSTLAPKQNLQARIKCVEWSLYRLFELWSPSETRDVWRVSMQANCSSDTIAEASSFLSSSYAPTIFEPPCLLCIVPLPS